MAWAWLFQAVACHCSSKLLQWPWLSNYFFNKVHDWHQCTMPTIITVAMQSMHAFYNHHNVLMKTKMKTTYWRGCWWWWHIFLLSSTWSMFFFLFSSIKSFSLFVSRFFCFNTSVHTTIHLCNPYMTYTACFQPTQPIFNLPSLLQFSSSASFVISISVVSHCFPYYSLFSSRIIHQWLTSSHFDYIMQFL